MIVFDLRKIPRDQFDALGQAFFQSYCAGEKNPIFRALMLAVAAETLDRAGKLPSSSDPIDLHIEKATAEQAEQARRFFQAALDDAALSPARYRQSREFFRIVLDEINGEAVPLGDTETTAHV